jgi:hypothetical protein
LGFTQSAPFKNLLEWGGHEHGGEKRERERERESYLIRGPFLILLAGFLLKASNHKNGVDMMPLAC